jgi:hypothetical protein
MTETPSGNRWEPTGDLGAPSETPPAEPAGVVGAVGPVAPVEYGWAPAPAPAARPRRNRRRTGVLAGGALAVLLGAGAGGYAIGAATAGSDSPDVGTTRQGPAGSDPQGFPGRDDDDHDRLGGPGDNDGAAG